jgi:hypothetical protein
MNRKLRRIFEHEREEAIRLQKRSVGAPERGWKTVVQWSSQKQNIMKVFTGVSGLANGSIEFLRARY